MYYPNTGLIIRIHDDLCEAFGNRKGILSLWQLESLCAHIQNDEYYPTVFDKLAHLFFWLVQFHLFVDANKRTSLLIALLFIIWNKELFPDINIEKSALFIEQLTLAVATWKTKEWELPIIFREYFE